MAKIVTIPRGSWGMRVGVIVVALVAGFQTVRSGLAYYLSTPMTVETALKIDPGSSWARSMAADERLKTVQMGADAAALAAFSRDILTRSPYDAVALRDIGIITAANDNEPQADKLLSLAGRLSLRDYLTHAWLLDYRFRKGALNGAVREADIVLRQQPENWDIVMPALIALTRERSVIPALAATIATRPAWRETFLNRLGTLNPAPDNTFALLMRLKALGAPAAQDEINAYFIKSGETMPAPALYRQWLALLPADARIDRATLLRDGDFAGLNAPPPFGWRLFPADGVYAERHSNGPAGMATSLYAAFAADKYTVFATQELVLTPGRYRFGGRGFSETAVEPGTFSWVVACRTIGHEAPLMQLPLNLSPGKLETYASEFAVPDGCDRQELALVGADNGASLDSPAVNVDGLTLTPVR